MNSVLSPSLRVLTATTTLPLHSPCAELLDVSFTQPLPASSALSVRSAYLVDGAEVAGPVEGVVDLDVAAVDLPPVHVQPHGRPRPLAHVGQPEEK